MFLFAGARRVVTAGGVSGFVVGVNGLFAGASRLFAGASRVIADGVTVAGKLGDRLA